MKLLLLALFVAVATASPIPDDDGGPIDVIVNGVPDGQPLELGGVVDIKVKEIVEGEVVSASNVLHPFTAVGIAEAAAAEEAQNPIIPAEPEVPEHIVIPEPALPEIIPDPIVIPEPALPEVIPDVPGSIVMPDPALPEVHPDVPGSIVMPEPVLPEVVPEPIEIPAPPAPEVLPEPIPEPAPQIPNGEIFNDGQVSVHLNAPQEPAGILTTLQSWFNMVLNYISNGVTTSTQQIV